MAFEFIQQAVAQRQQAGLLRRRQCIDSSVGSLIEIQGQHYLNFSSNDYLGMRQSLEVMQAWVDGISQTGAGSGASPLVTGYTRSHQALEAYLAEALNREAVVLFNSGFAANQAICQALLGKQSQVVADKLIHASFVDGAMASDGKFRRFRHNDIAHLEQLLRDCTQDTLVATEGVFSMDGDLADVEGILPVVENHGAWLMLDDAHGLGVLGETGMGSAEAFNLSQHQVPVLMGTFGKAVGTAGAFIAGSQDLIDYLLNFARHYIYSTAMPPAQADATLASLHVIRQAERRAKLHENLNQFKTLAKSAGIELMPSDTAIQPVLIGDPDESVRVSSKLRSLGLWVTAIRYPTVPKGTDRLRVTLTAAHQTKDIEALVDGLQLALFDAKGGAVE